MALFSALPVIWLAPFFSTKSICMTRFFRIPMWKAPFFWHPGIVTYFSLRYFSRLLVLLMFSELTVIFVWQPAINVYKKSKDSLWIGQHFRRSSIWMGPFSKARYMNGVGFEILTRTLVTQSPLSYPLPTPLSPTPEFKIWLFHRFFWKGWYEILILLTSVRACCIQF